MGSLICVKFRNHQMQVLGATLFLNAGVALMQYHFELNGFVHSLCANIGETTRGKGDSHLTSVV